MRATLISFTCLVAYVTFTSACKSCSNDLVTISKKTPGSHAFDTDSIDSSGSCAVRTLTCKGKQANIEINYGVGVIPDVKGTATLKLTCNSGSTAWTVEGTTVNRVECASARD